ncbi:hypothetical protein B0H15DRAFT_801548 [Mycena belliarum]|uniref:Uncharacterized protein n=1 Tax=Mycena belliarum TaxID=1033014 RepID=A0AAD6U247_9AGAR|nr:hypothetical protein B0H15DRAFT_801548 [Mycena belliae]
MPRTMPGLMPPSPPTSEDDPEDDPTLALAAGTQSRLRRRPAVVHGRVRPAATDVDTDRATPATVLWCGVERDTAPGDGWWDARCPPAVPFLPLPLDSLDAKPQLRKRSRTSNGCGARVHESARPARAGLRWVARPAGVEGSVIPLEATYFAEDDRMALGLGRRGCGGNALGALHTPCRAHHVPLAPAPSAPPPALCKGQPHYVFLPAAVSPPVSAAIPPITLTDADEPPALLLEARAREAARRALQAVHRIALAAVEELDGGGQAAHMPPAPPPPVRAVNEREQPRLRRTSPRVDLHAPPPEVPPESPYFEVGAPYFAVPIDALETPRAAPSPPSSASGPDPGPVYFPPTPSATREQDPWRAASPSAASMYFAPTPVLRAASPPAVYSPPTPTWRAVHSEYFPPTPSPPPPVALPSPRRFPSPDEQDAWLATRSSSWMGTGELSGARRQVAGGRPRRASLPDLRGGGGGEWGPWVEVEATRVGEGDGEVPAADDREQRAATHEGLALQGETRAEEDEPERPPRGVAPVQVQDEDATGRGDDAAADTPLPMRAALIAREEAPEPAQGSLRDDAATHSVRWPSATHGPAVARGEGHETLLDSVRAEGAATTAQEEHAAAPPSPTDTPIAARQAAHERVHDSLPQPTATTAARRLHLRVLIVSQEEGHDNTAHDGALAGQAGAAHDEPAAPQDDPAVPPPARHHAPDVSAIRARMEAATEGWNNAHDVRNEPAAPVAPHTAPAGPPPAQYRAPDVLAIRARMEAVTEGGRARRRAPSMAEAQGWGRGAAASHAHDVGNEPAAPVAPHAAPAGPSFAHHHAPDVPAIRARMEAATEGGRARRRAPSMAEAQGWGRGAAASRSASYSASGFLGLGQEEEGDPRPTGAVRRPPMFGR